MKISNTARRIDEKMKDLWQSKMKSRKQKSLNMELTHRADVEVGGAMDKYTKRGKSPSVKKKKERDPYAPGKCTEKY